MISLRYGSQWRFRRKTNYLLIPVTEPERDGSLAESALRVTFQNSTHRSPTSRGSGVGAFSPAGTWIRYECLSIRRRCCGVCRSKQASDERVCKASWRSRASSLLLWSSQWRMLSRPAVECNLPIDCDYGRSATWICTGIPLGILIGPVTESPGLSSEVAHVSCL